MSNPIEIIFNAAAEGDADSLAHALESGLSALDRDDFGRTPLMIAANNGHHDCVKMLLPLSEPETVDELGRDALMHAAAGGCVLCVRELMGSCDPLAEDDAGSTALIVAAGSTAECVNALLAGSDPAAVNVWGRNALMNAADAGKDDCVEALLPWNDPAQTDQNGETALGIALKNNQKKCVQLLLGHCGPSERTDGLNAALRLACALDDGVWASRLLADGANPNDKDKKGQTPLMIAAGVELPEIKRWMEDALNPFAAQPAPPTPQARGCDRKPGEPRPCWEILLPVSNPLLTDKEGDNALMRAVMAHNAEAVRALGPVSDLMVKNQQKRTVADLAKDNERLGSPDCAQALREARAEIERRALLAECEAGQTKTGVAPSKRPNSAKRV